ncbi:MAG: hypothetical protein SP1CHLAM54_05380 [Chlamydiia bacterium]|nr:hypothetical protein [Chlamydiia bacterium]MCH9615449.1 hypothetical protein [Chlamydiia bacterium]MCH9628229.1 hypothetical protein [Chlamydiia bacterium]
MLAALVPLPVAGYALYHTFTTCRRGYLGVYRGLEATPVNEPILGHYFEEMVSKLDISNRVLLVTTKKVDCDITSFGHSNKKMVCVVAFHPRTRLKYTTAEMKFLVTRELVKIKEGDHASWSHIPDLSTLTALMLGSIIGPFAALGGALSARFALAPCATGFREELVDRMALASLTPSLRGAALTCLEKQADAAWPVEGLFLLSRVEALRTRLQDATP